MMTRRSIDMALVAMAVCLWLAASAFAGQPQQALTDQTFIEKAVVGGLAEVQLGKMAADMAASAEVIFDLIADPSQQPRWDGNDNLAEADPRPSWLRAGHKAHAAVSRFR
jgi:hypothetical protein